MSWAQRKQLIYGGLTFIVIALAIGLPIYYKYFDNAPTCFDNKRDGDETGVDCGGSCQQACSDQIVPEPITIWSQAFPVANGIYNLVAYVQNPNVSYIAEPTQYVFRVYDKDNILIGVREGYADIPPTKTFPIFEQGFDAGYRVPAKVFFAFQEEPSWQKYNGTKPELDISDQTILTSTSTQKVTAQLTNKTVQDYQNVEVDALVYDGTGNAMAASRTFVKDLPGTGQDFLIFTWPQAFPSAVSKVELVPKLPVSVFVNQ
jgi:hypothetical protein